MGVHGTRPSTPVYVFFIVRKKKSFTLSETWCEICKTSSMHETESQEMAIFGDQQELNVSTVVRPHPTQRPPSAYSL